jgi:glycosyltransferase involved in cell wall biosynthesis
VFGYIGTIVEAKGIDTLIAGFKAAAPENARLQVIGPAHDRAYAESVERGLDSSCNVSLLPPASASQVPDLLEAFDVLCLPSLVPETFSLSLHEGFAAGLPSLVSDLGHPADVVEEYRCGQVLPAGDVQAWSQAIAAICADPSRLLDLSSRVPLPWRLEEEAFVYSQLYRACTADAQS